MATIARLDSNGIKVITENTRKPGDSPLVDSSTGPTIDNLMQNVSNIANNDGCLAGKYLNYYEFFFFFYNCIALK